jgi:alkylhydroperoxidase family enzyme
MQSGLSEAKIQKMHHYETSDLSEREKMALRLADTLALDHHSIDTDFMTRLKAHFSEEEIIDLGMSIAFLFGWGRFIEAFAIVPDTWEEGVTCPWEPVSYTCKDRLRKIGAATGAIPT